MKQIIFFLISGCWLNFAISNVFADDVHLSAQICNKTLSQKVFHFREIEHGYASVDGKVGKLFYLQPNKCTVINYSMKFSGNDNDGSRYLMFIDSLTKGTFKIHGEHVGSQAIASYVSDFDIPGYVYIENNKGIFNVGRNTSDSRLNVDIINQPKSIFTNFGNGCIKDISTGLVWVASPSLLGYGSWDLLYRKVIQMNTLPTAVDYHLCGYSDWRMPTKYELNILAQHAKLSGGDTPYAEWFNKNGFHDIRYDYGYWSMSANHTYLGNLEWSVNMFDGDVSIQNLDLYHYVWPVRGGHYPVKDKLIIK